MSALPDGLELLNQKRTAARAKRTMPPPRHPRPQAETTTPTPVEPPAPKTGEPPATVEASATPGAREAIQASLGERAVEPQTPTATPVKSQATPGPAVEGKKPTTKTNDEESTDGAETAPPQTTSPAGPSSVERSMPTSKSRRASDASPAVTAALGDQLDPPAAPSRPSSTSTSPKTEVKPITVSMDERDIDFLDQLRILGLTSRPKLDISRSAVVRLALQRLQAQMSSEEIGEYLRNRAAEGAVGPGRRRL